MALHEDMMAFGVNSQLALMLARSPASVPAVGATQASAATISESRYLVVVRSGSSSLNMPTVNPSKGSYVGDQYVVYNQTAASVTLFAANSILGSVVTIYSSAASTLGTTGLVIPAGALARLQSVGNSTWIADPILNPALQVTLPQQLEVKTPVIATVFGTTVGSANAIAANQYFTYSNTGTSALKLPAVNTSTGPYLGDQFVIANMTSASIQIFSPANGAGSVVVFQGGSVSASGGTGVTIPAGYVGTFQIATVSIWVVGIASV